MINNPLFNQLLQDDIYRLVLKSGVVVIVAYIIRQAFFRLIDIALQRLPVVNLSKHSIGFRSRVLTITSILHSVTDFLVLFIVVVTVLSTWGIDITPILTGAGILGLAVGFGSQTLVKDVVTGFFILLENQYNVGDVIKIGHIKGVVYRMNLRTTVMKEVSGRVTIIPNSTITSVTVFRSNNETEVKDASRPRK